MRWRETSTVPSERRKMLAGEMYDPFGLRSLAAARERARDLCQALNSTREASNRRNGGASSMRAVRSGRRLRLDAAAVLLRLRREHRLGERVFFNFNCVVLDVCAVRIGDYTLIGPAVQIDTALHPLNAGSAASRNSGSL